MKGMGRKKLKHLKHVSLQEATSKNVAIIEQKRKQFVYIPTRSIYLQKLPLKLTL